MTSGTNGTSRDSEAQEKRGHLRTQRYAGSALAVVLMAATLAVNPLVTSAARASGTEALYAFGDNTDGALGNGGTSDAFLPTVITLPSGVTPTGGAAGGDHTLVMGSNGVLYAWGLGTDGQLGNGTTTTSSTAVQVSLPPGVAPVAVSAGQNHSLALGSNGNLYAWGYNGFGQLGIGTTANQDTPVTVGLPSGVRATAISAGTNFSLALGSDGNVYAWGDGNLGALGQGNQNQSNTPVKVPLPSGVTASAIAAGGRFAMAIGSDGTLYSWGNVLGNNTSTSSTSPVVVAMPAGVTANVISAGNVHALAIGSNGLLYSWGQDPDGQLGNGVRQDTKAPGLVSMPTGVTAVAIAGGLDHSLAIGSDGNLYAWGVDGAGELGNGFTTNSNIPVLVSLPTAAHPPTTVFAGSNGDRSFVIAPPTPTATTTTLASSATSAVLRPNPHPHRLSEPHRRRRYRQVPATVQPRSRVQFGGAGTGRLQLSGAVFDSFTPPGQRLLQRHLWRRHGVRLVEHDHAGRRHRCPGSVGRHGLVGLVDLRQHAAARQCVVQRLREWRLGIDADQPGVLFEHGHVGQRVGQYATTCTGAVDANYAITYASGTLSVAPAPLEHHRLVGDDDLRCQPADH